GGGFPTPAIGCRTTRPSRSTASCWRFLECHAWWVCNDCNDPAAPFLPVIQAFRLAMVAPLPHDGARALKTPRVPMFTNLTRKAIIMKRLLVLTLAVLGLAL